MSTAMRPVERAGAGRGAGGGSGGGAGEWRGGEEGIFGTADGRVKKEVV